MEEDIIIKERIEKVLPLLDEKLSRLYLGAEFQSIGWGGQTKISELSGKSRFLIARGEKELQNSELQSDNNCVRHKGAGRKKEVDKHPELISIIRELVSPHTVGDPESLLLWTSRSIRHLQEDLRKLGYIVSHEYIRQTLISEGYSMQSDKKTKEGGEHVDRDAQFEYIDNMAKARVVEIACGKLNCKNLPMKPD